MFIGAADSLQLSERFAVRRLAALWTHKTDRSRMKRLKLFLTIFILANAALAGADYSDFKDGDIIYQTSHSAQSEAIQRVT